MANPKINTLFLLNKGRDDWGPWTIASSKSADKAHWPTCPVCHKPVAVILSYYQLHLPTGIKPDSTILKRTRRPIGVSCGCWSRFTRQVVHISESLMRKGYSV